MGAASRRDHARVRRLAKMGSALLRGVERDLRGGNPEPHFDGPGDHVRHDDLVAARMVAPGMDLVFIIDFTLTAILLVPQLLAWVYAHPEKVKSRAVGMWLVFLPAPFLLAKIGEIVGAPISGRAGFGAMLVFAVFFLLPALLRWGVKVRPHTWNLALLA